MIKYVETTIYFQSDTDGTLFSDGEHIMPLFIKNLSPNTYPIFLPYKYGNVIRARALSFSVTNAEYLKDITLTVGVWYIEV